MFVLDAQNPYLLWAGQIFTITRILSWRLNRQNPLKSDSHTAGK